jgi:hypothetical protein
MLAELKLASGFECEQRFKAEGRHRWYSGDPGIPYLQYDGALFTQELGEPRRETFQPREIRFTGFVSISFLPDKGKRG